MKAIATKGGTVGLVAVGAVALALALAGCSGASADAHPATSDLVDDPVSTADTERLGDVPQECIDAMPYVLTPADIAAIAQLPEFWPEEPVGATLCATSTGGDVETASFVTDAPIEEVLAHYEAALSGQETFRVSGEENGTGYESLTGSVDGIGFQVQERDAGFTLAFAPEAME